MIIFNDVTKLYSTKVAALKNVNLKIDDGEFVFVLGKSGAGKSTFIKLIMGELTPTSGQVEVNGYHIPGIKKRQIPYLRRSMGVVFQDFRLIESKTVFDNIAFALYIAGARGREIRRRVLDSLEVVGLQDKARSYPQQLSGGEQQRVAVARALINEPSLIIADEPTGNVDPGLSFGVIEMFNEINRRGTTVVMVTHEHELVAHYDKRIIIIDQGRIGADTDTLALKQQDGGGIIG